MACLKMPYNSINYSRLLNLDMPSMVISYPNSQGAGREFSMYIYVEDSKVYTVIQNMSLPANTITSLDEDDEDLPTSIDSNLSKRNRFFDSTELPNR
jgi:hypothetical protein